MNNVFLGIGTNLGHREVNIKETASMIEENIGTLLRTSSVYETEPWGFSSDNQFLNLVVEVDTELSPLALIPEIDKIETYFGRIRNEESYSSRIIDIDIILYRDLIIYENNLKIPHPLMHERKFVLVPMNEIASGIIHPVFMQSIASLLRTCKDKCKISLLTSRH